jgi:Xaa-Pro aminopeptidase
MAVSALGSLAPSFIHGLGHGLGLEIHEFPTINSQSKDILKKNMVVTIEPGSYFPKKGGIRVEDEVLVRAAKPRLLFILIKVLSLINS